MWDNSIVLPEIQHFPGMSSGLESLRSQTGPKLVLTGKVPSSGNFSLPFMFILGLPVLSVGGPKQKWGVPGLLIWGS